MRAHAGASSRSTRYSSGDGRGTGSWIHSCGRSPDPPPNCSAALIWYGFANAPRRNVSCSSWTPARTEVVVSAALPVAAMRRGYGDFGLIERRKRRPGHDPCVNCIRLSLAGTMRDWNAVGLEGHVHGRAAWDYGSMTHGELCILPHSGPPFDRCVIGRR